MKNFYLLLLIFLSGSAWGADGLDQQNIQGKWRYYLKIYQGVEMPEGPEATLRLNFEFLANGDSLLYWRHEGETDHCNRRGKYFTKDDYIFDEVVWVDPENTYGCDRDPDMQLGNKTTTPYFFRGNDLVIRFYLGDEPLDYVWKRVTAEDI